METAYQAAVSLWWSDINEHLPVLRALGGLCKVIVEMGVRSGQSSIAFLASRPDALHGVDIDEAPALYTSGYPCLHFHRTSSLTLDPIPCDLLFIDTFHVYGQLKRELARHAPTTAHFIVMHDTEVDGVDGEAVRNKWDPAEMAAKTGIPESEIVVGLQRAVDEFLEWHPAWRVLRHYVNKHGLTILVRKDSSLLPAADALLAEGSVSGLR